jgi:tetratricopeptide (TPR) repeat protein
VRSPFRRRVPRKRTKGSLQALLKEGLELLKKAAESSPEDLNVRFNYGIALFLQSDFMESAAQMRPIIATRPTDGEAYYVLSKALQQQNDAVAASTIDNQARTYLTAGNRYANLEKEWLKSKSINDVPLRVEQPQRKDFVSVVLSRRTSAPVQTAVSETENLLGQARTYYKNGNDDEAMAVLRRVPGG